MAEHPNLSLETQAAIDKTREGVLFWRTKHNLLFGIAGVGRGLSTGLISPTEPKPATLKLQLQGYNSALFDAEATFYATYAKDEPQLRSWLGELALRIEAEVTAEVQSPSHDFHCPAPERQRAITDGLKLRIDHWINAALNNPDVMRLRAGHEALARSAKVRAEYAEAESTDTTRLLEFGRAVLFPTTKSPAEAQSSAIDKAILTQQRLKEERLAAQAKNEARKRFAIERELEGLRIDATKTTSPEPTSTEKSPQKFRDPNPGLLANPDLTLSRIRSAEALGVTPRTIDRWVGEGKLTPVGTGARKRFKTKDLKRILAERNLDKRDKK